MDTPPIKSAVAGLFAFGNGILAADESFPTIDKRFKAINILSNKESRRACGERLFMTLGLSEFINGVILFDETIRQRTKDEVPVPELLGRQGAGGTSGSAV